MATVVRKPVSVPIPAPLPASTAAPTPAAPTPDAPVVPFRDRLALFIWLAGAGIMASLLLKDLAWSLLGLR